MSKTTETIDEILAGLEQGGTGLTKEQALLAKVRRDVEGNLAVQKTAEAMMAKALPGMNKQNKAITTCLKKWADIKTEAGQRELAELEQIING